MLPMKTQEKNRDDNPYATPAADMQVEIPSTDFQGKLYQPLSIAIASLFGGCLAAGILLQSNSKSLKRTTESVVLILVTIIFTTAYLFSSLLMKQLSWVTYLWINFAIAVLIMPISIWLQGTALDKHDASGYLFHSNWRGGLMGVVSFFALLIILSAAFFLYWAVLGQ